MLRSTLSELLGSGPRSNPDDPAVCECRRCGATVDAPDDACPYCGPSTEIVCYRLH